MGKKKEYFPNNWELYHAAPDEMFHQHTFEEIMEWKVAGWELPSSVFCMIRVDNARTGKVQEFIYQKPGSAKKKVFQLMDDPDNEITMCDHDEMHCISYGPLDPDEQPYNPDDELQNWLR